MKNAITAVAVTLALACTPAYAEENPTVIHFDGRSFDPSTSDLFQGKANLSPGDTFTTLISISNDSNKIQSFFFSLDDPDSLSTEEQTLLEATTLIVESAQGDAFYEGPLSATQLRQGIELDTCEPQESVDLVVEIHAPKELGNGFAMSKDLLHWRFWAIPEEDTAFQEVFAPLSGTAYDKTGYQLLPFGIGGLALAIIGISAFALGKRKNRQ